MEKMELHSTVEERMAECWDAYRERLLALPPEQIIDKAKEIAAARLCMEELTESAAYYPAHYLEHLLEFDDPLEIIREQWMEEQGFDCSEDMEHALWSLWDHGPQPDDAPAMSGMI